MNNKEYLKKWREKNKGHYIEVIASDEELSMVEQLKDHFKVKTKSKAVKIAIQKAYDIFKPVK